MGPKHSKRSLALAHLHLEHANKAAWGHGRIPHGEPKKFMAQYMTDDLKALDDLQHKYSHLLQHHGFQGREASTTVDEIKKVMKQDISEITVVDARAKTLKNPEGNQ